MSAETSALLLIVAILVGVMSLIAIVASLRPKPQAEAVSMWPPAFFYPLPSDATLLQPRTASSHNAVTLSGGAGGLRVVRDPETGALSADDAKYKTAEIRLTDEAETTNKVAHAGDAETTNKVIQGGDTDATSKNPLK
jgi:hypothetical protein